MIWLSGAALPSSPSGSFGGNTLWGNVDDCACALSFTLCACMRSMPGRNDFHQGIRISSPFYDRYHLHTNQSTPRQQTGHKIILLNIYKKPTWPVPLSGYYREVMEASLNSLSQTSLIDSLVQRGIHSRSYTFSNNRRNSGCGGRGDGRALRRRGRRRLERCGHVRHGGSLHMAPSVSEVNLTWEIKTTHTVVAVGIVVASIVVVEAARFKQLHAAESLVAAMRASFLVRSFGQPVGTGRASLSTAERLFMTKMRHVIVFVEVERVVVVVTSVSVVKVVIVLLHVRHFTTLTVRYKMAHVMSVAVVAVVDKSVAVAVTVAVSPVSVVVVVTGSMARYSRQKSSACCARDGKHSSEIV